MGKNIEEDACEFCGSELNYLPNPNGETMLYCPQCSIDNDSEFEEDEEDLN